MSSMALAMPQVQVEALLSSGFWTVHHPSQKLGPNGPIVFRVGVWGPDEEFLSSNYRELTNLVEDMEAEVRTGGLQNAELFLCTDNLTAESSFYKGTSLSRVLHPLILRFHKMAMEYGIIIHLIHVSGKRMRSQEMDGCSRGVLLEGVMAGKDMLLFFDLDKSVFE